MALDWLVFNCRIYQMKGEIVIKLCSTPLHYLRIHTNKAVSTLSTVFCFVVCVLCVSVCEWMCDKVCPTYHVCVFMCLCVCLSVSVFVWLCVCVFVCEKRERFVRRALCVQHWSRIEQMSFFFFFFLFFEWVHRFLSFTLTPSFTLTLENCLLDYSFYLSFFLFVFLSFFLYFIFFRCSIFENLFPKYIPLLFNQRNIKHIIYSLLQLRNSDIYFTFLPPWVHLKYSQLYENKDKKERKRKGNRQQKISRSEKNIRSGWAYKRKVFEREKSEREK